LRCCDCFGLRPRNDGFVFASEAKQFLVMASAAKQILDMASAAKQFLVMASEAKPSHARLLQPFGLRNDALK